MLSKFVVDGKPVGKDRPRFTRSGHTYPTKKNQDYMRLVGESYKAAGGHWYGRAPVKIRIIADMQLPKRTPKKMIEKLLAVLHPIKRPDVDNIAKIVMDGLNGIAYVDDAQVWKLEIEKRNALEGKVTVWVEGEEEQQ